MAWNECRFGVVVKPGYVELVGECGGGVCIGFAIKQAIEKGYKGCVRGYTNISRET